MLFIKSSSKLHADTYGVKYTIQVCQNNVTAVLLSTELVYYVWDNVILNLFPYSFCDELEISIAW